MSTLRATKRSRGSLRDVRTAIAVVALAVVTAMAGGVAGAAGPGSGHGGGGGEEGGDSGSTYVSPSAIHRVKLGGASARITQLTGPYAVWGDTMPDASAAGDVVFASTKPAADGTTDSELYLLRSDGTLVQLTDNTSIVSSETGEETPVNELNPVFSPDGSWIAYDRIPEPVVTEESEGGSEGGGAPPGTSGLAGVQIWILHVSDPAAMPIMVTSVKASGGAAKEPTWSPDGTKIAFTHGDGQRSSVAMVDLAGKVDLATGLVSGLPTATITELTAQGHYMKPAWHPVDANVVAFTKGAGVMGDIWTRNISTGAYYQLTTESSIAESRPDWSPDGSLVAYQKGDDAIGASVWVMNVDGTGKTAVTTAPTTWSDRNPAFAGADTIVYESTETAPPVADLALTKTADPATLTVGGTTTYTVSVFNYGPLTAPAVTVVDTLPAGMAYVSAQATFPVSEHGEETTATTPTVTVSGQVVTIVLGDLAKGERGAAVATITVVARAVQPGSLVNTAVVSLTAPAGSSITDPVAANDVASATTLVTAPSSGGGGGSASEQAPALGAAPGVFKPPTAAVPKGCTIMGTAGDDVLVGTAGADRICGLGGNDRLVGNGGNDLLIGGPGADRLEGGAGNDVANGGEGNDVVDGMTGNDVLYGDAGNDRLLHKSGTDKLFAGTGDDVLEAKDGKYDWLNGGLGRDRALLDKGIDRYHSIEVIG